MKRILVTGGTVFVGRYVAQYYVEKGDEVYVLNRNSRKQVDGVKLIEGDRHQLKNGLKEYDFDVVLDITAYTKDDVKCLIEALGNVKEYILLSSSAVYPETLTQPFKEEQQVGPNKYWGNYGVNKYEAEQYLMNKIPHAYIIRPPYLYGPMNNVYREAFVFECAMNNSMFYVPQDGNMTLQFFYINDLCRFIDAILDKHPQEHIFNVGNKDSVTINEWVKTCYQVVGKEPKIVNVNTPCNQREYFSFYDYDYRLDISIQNEIMPDTKPLLDGLKESFEWYKEHSDEVNRKPYIEYIDKNLTDYI